LAAVNYKPAFNAAAVYTSTNAGVTWTSNALSSRSFSCVASSVDGTKLAVAGDPSGIYTSTNSGDTWTATSAPVEYYQSIACSADGSTLIAVTDYNITSTGPGPVYTSTDSGVTWVSNIVNGVFWQTAFSSADGSKLVAVGNYPFLGPKGGIYVSPPEVLLSGTVSSNSIVLSWPTNATGFGLEQNLDLTTTNWVAVTNAPTTTKGNKQVLLSITNNDNLFFRLKQ
jgi:hypothetical protein